jgi:hypothetical protein
MVTLDVTPEELVAEIVMLVAGMTADGAPLRVQSVVEKLRPAGIVGV